MNLHSGSLIAASVFALSAMSCASEGALGQSQSSAACSPSDFVCAFQGLDKPLAAGATLPIDVTLDLQGSATPPLALLSADDTVLAVDGSVLTGKGPGLAALLITIPGNLVVDFFHVWVEQPTSVALHRRTEEGGDLGPMPEHLEVLVGDELFVSLEPFSGAQRLLGEPEATWSGGSAAVQIVDSGTPGRRRLVAREPGTATISAEAFGVTADLSLEVLP
jgi:hypothetical protein